MGRKKYVGVTVTQENTIQISFTYNSKNCRERIKLQPTAANLAAASRHRQAIIESIALGTFDYTVTFPESKTAKSIINSKTSNKQTLKKYLTAWWRKEKSYIKASTASVDQRTLFNQIIPGLGYISLHDLAWIDIKNWMDQYQWSHKTQNNKLSLLRRALNEAVEDEIISINPMDNKKIRRRKGRSSQRTESTDHIDPFDHNERIALINTATGQLKNIIQFGFWTGLRPSELFALDWSQVDFINNRIYVDSALTQAASKPESTKTEASERIVDLMPQALQALHAQKSHTFMQNKEVFQNPRTLERWTGDLVLRKHHWKTLCIRAGVRYRPPKQMRHSFASMCLMAGESPQWVARQMGHTDWTFTVRVYYRWIPNDDKHSGEKVSKKWQSVT